VRYLGLRAGWWPTLLPLAKASASIAVLFRRQH